MGNFIKDTAFKINTLACNFASFISISIFPF